MKLITTIEYFTRWGEQLFLRTGDRLIPMEYVPDGTWRSETDRLKPGQTFEYRYEVHSGGLCRRTEWKSHTAVLPKGGRTAEIHDSWNDVPEALPLHSSPFADGVFRTVPGKVWKAAGTAIPVFSLRSENGFGIGEFNDLRLLADWAAATGQKVIQLLPVNDTTMTGTWEDSYPYKANSSFALHPQFIHLPDAGVETDDEYMMLKAELNLLPEMDYEKVNNEKHRLLRQAFAKTGKNVLRTAKYKEFVAKNASWLLSYSVFCTLRDEYGTADFSKWGEFSKYDADKAEKYRLGHKAETDYWCFVQYHLHLQLTQARDYARSKGIVFKGDLPIGVSRTSADAWVNARLFNLDSQAGAPPDAFSTAGQNWGFPTYNWDEMSKDGYAWWKERLGKMSEYFDAFRIDHILGFFRIWEIPMSATRGLLGHFSPALPYSSEELHGAGFDMSDGRYSSPSLDEANLDRLFGERKELFVKKCLKNGKLRPEYSTQRKVTEKLSGNDGDTAALREGLLTLLEDVLFVEDPRRKGWWHPRIAAQFTYAYSMLDGWQRMAFDHLYNDFFYRRHNAFWKESAMKKLPSLLSATGMLACGEDLGMIPDCVAEVMSEYQILSLEIQRMSKDPHVKFADPAHYPYYSVCTTSTHDMNPLRAWWEEEREESSAFWHEMMHRQDEMPYFCEPWICREIVESHLRSSSMLTILPLQDWLSINGKLRFADPKRERINVPAIPRYYWRYRMHLKLETLLCEEGFNADISEMISISGRK